MKNKWKLSKTDSEVCDLIRTLGYSEVAEEIVEGKHSVLESLQWLANIRMNQGTWREQAIKVAIEMVKVSHKIK